MSTFGFLLLWNVVLATLLALLVSLASRMKILQRRPAIIHLLWLIVLAKLVTPPLIPLPVLPGLQQQAELTSSQGNPPERSSAELLIVASLPAIEEPPAVSRGGQLPWLAILAGVSCCGTLVVFTACVWQFVRISRLLRCETSGNERLERLAHISADVMATARCPGVYVVHGSLSPFLWVRWSGPVVVLPRELVERMSDEQITCIFCHELAHHARRDHWSNAFALTVVVLLWWHPVAWWARRELRATQEICCDGLVLAAGTVTRRSYAETLFQVLEFVQSNRPLTPTMASGFGSRCALTRRFEMIANREVTERCSWWVATLLVAGAVSLLCIPVRAQPEKTENPPAAKAPPRPDDGPLHKVKIVERATLAFDALEATVDPTKHCIFVTETDHKTRTGALRVDLERGVTYTFQATGEAFMTSQTGVDADPFPGLVLYYPTSEEDCYAWRMAVVKPGDSVTFETPYLIRPQDEVFALAFFLAIVPDEHRGSYKLAVKKSKETSVERNQWKVLLQEFDEEASKLQIQYLRYPARPKP